MVKEIAAFVLLALPTILEATLDYREWRQGKKDKKTLDVVLRGLGMLVVGVIVSWFTDHQFWQGTLYSLGIFILFFDYIMGELLIGDIFFLGSTSKTDKGLKKYSKYLLMVGRIVFFISSAIVYYAI